jgi:hypothetical protein
MLDSPWPMNSWLASMRCSERTAMAREIDTASVSASMVITSAGPRVWRRVSSEKSGIDSGGSCAGRRRR